MQQEITQECTQKHSLKETYSVKDYTGKDPYYGIHRVSDGWVYREYAPDARQVYLAGEFNDWEYENFPMLPVGNGNWILFFPGEAALWEDCRIKTIVISHR